ncbi:MAG: flagellar basal-body rod protein FlgG [Desulfovibrionaceae bacterium]|nr:flagellar basal-body rod protein FlgG [Desulfovibrionaceae bacterium]MBF0512953.1 flagellar basal-body rod protein FlgG [Desulfovibrionaceae bacterium]
MMRSLYTATTGMVAMQMQIDVMSNNLANVSTVGFKKSRAEFEDLMYQTQNVAGAQTVQGNLIPTGLQVGLGVRPTTVHKYFAQGDFQNTGNPLDLAIEGDGFFKVDYNGTDAYTRAGSFELNQNGQVVTSDGYVLQPAFTVPQNTSSIVVTENGTLTALAKDGTTLGTSTMSLYTFTNPAGLTAKGRNLYQVSEASGAAQENTPGQNDAGTIAQGYLEMSNVQLVDEMVGLITAQRAYEANSKVITTADAMLSTAMGVKR